MKSYSFANEKFEFKNGSIHILNISYGIFGPTTFFETYNKQILDLAVDNPDKVKVTLVSDPRKANLLKTKNSVTGLLENLPSGFALEIKYMREKGIKEVFLIDRTTINLDNINLEDLDWSLWKF